MGNGHVALSKLVNCNFGLQTKV